MSGFQELELDGMSNVKCSSLSSENTETTWLHGYLDASVR